MIKLQGTPSIITQDEVLDVIRLTAIAYESGLPVSYDQKNFKIRCNVQPVDGKDLLLVPEGDRQKEQYYVWSLNPCPENGILQINDQVVRKGISFQTQSVENWGSYVKARIMCNDVGPNASNPPV